jgi:hypothetical protein
MFQIQEWSNLVWEDLFQNSPSGSGNLTIVRHCWQSVVERKAMGFDTQALSNTAWAAATLGFGMTTSATAASPNNYVDLPSAHPICTAIQPLLSRNSSQGLGNLAWALARLLGDYSNANVVAALGAQSSWPDTIRALLLGIGQQLANPRRAVESQAIANTLWALAKLKLNDESLHRSIAARLTIAHSQYGYIVVFCGLPNFQYVAYLAKPWMLLNRTLHLLWFGYIILVHFLYLLLVC